MIVTIPLGTLVGGTTAADGWAVASTGPAGGPSSRDAPLGFALLDGRFAISAQAARRLACDAAIVPAVLGSRGEVLDLGRRTRVVSAAQRRAVIARDRHCAHPGCRRSPRYCDVHHVIPWCRGGPTALANLVLLCPYHHHQIHHSEWAIVMAEGRPTFVPPAWLDPSRRPRGADHATVGAA